jgi:DNA-binding transcriptional LysR family regulator
MHSRWRIWDFTLLFLRKAFAVLLCGSRLLPHVSEIVNREGPGIDLRVRGFRDRQNAIHLLDEGIADVAIGVSLGTEARILMSRLFTERFVCIARRGSSASSALRNVERFAAARHVLVSPEGEEHGVVDVALAERGMMRRLRVVPPHMYAAPHLVANSNNLVATLMEGVMVNYGFLDHLVVVAPPLESCRPTIFTYSCIAAPISIRLIDGLGPVLLKQRPITVVRRADSLRVLILACCRFRRHRVRCHDGTGGGSWRDGDLPGSSSLRVCG